MSTFDALILIAAVTGVLLGLWTLLNFVFDCIEDYHAAWREERHRESQPTAEDVGKPAKGTGS